MYVQLITRSVFFGLLIVAAGRSMAVSGSFEGYAQSVNDVSGEAYTSTADKLSCQWNLLLVNGINPTELQVFVLEKTMERCEDGYPIASDPYEYVLLDTPQAYVWSDNFSGYTESISYWLEYCAGATLYHVSGGSSNTNLGYNFAPYWYPE